MRAAIRNLPQQGEIKGRQLLWSGGVTNLAANHFLGFGVDPEHSGQLARAAQVQVEFGRRDAQIILATGDIDVGLSGGLADRVQSRGGRRMVGRVGAGVAGGSDGGDAGGVGDFLGWCWRRSIACR